MKTEFKLSVLTILPMVLMIACQAESIGENKMLHGKYLSQDEKLGVLVFNKDGRFGYSNPTKLDHYTVDNLPNKNFGEYKLDSSRIILKYDKIMQGQMPSKMRFENNGNTIILERESDSGTDFPKTAIYQKQP